MRTRSVALAALLVLATATPALAQPKNGAQASFEAAIELYDKKDFAAALGRFKEAYAGTKSPNARLYIARCQRELGNLEEALAEMQGALAEATARAKKEPRYVETRDALTKELGELERSVAYLTVTIDGGGPGLEVKLGTQVLAGDRLGKPMVLKAGRTTISAAMPGKKTVTRDVDLVAGQRQAIAIAFGEGADPVVQPPVVKNGSTSPVDIPKQDDEPSPSYGIVIGGVVVAAVGVGGLVSFAVTGSMAKSNFDQVEEECGGQRCTDPKYADVVSEGRTLSLVANISLGVGAACLAGGALMVGLGWPKSSSSKTAAKVSFGPTPGGAFLTVDQPF